ncbi:sepA, partial [Symbiodinium natans]
MVGLSMFSDVRTAWHPTVRKARNSEATWVDVPVYLAMRHAAHNWGHHAVETSLALYALIMSHEDLFEASGKRLVFFLDACSLELQGDAIEFCMRFVPNSLGCLQDISSSCAKFTSQLWPLLSDWAPLEKGNVQERLPGARTLCFRSVVAGLSPWKRPVQTQDAMGRPLTQQEWAADPFLAPVIRHFRVHALARLNVRSKSADSPILLAAIKRERRSLRNREEVLDWLRESASKRRLGFAELDFAGQTLADQARLLASTALFVASMGATLL